VRARSRPRLELPEGLVYELLTPPTAKLLSVNRTTIPPGFDNRERPFAHPGQECVHVLQGVISIVLVEESLQLEAGDSLTFEASTPHSYVNRGPENVVVIVSASPSNA
jgi:quercetin dioxygenase-like cupin family protein